MNRTIVMLTTALALPLAPLSAQESDESSQSPAVMAVLASVEKAELALKGVRLRMTTTARLPGGPEMRTSGEVRVLRGTQPGDAGMLYTALEYAFGDGLRGRMVAAQTAAGIDIFEEDPAFGAAFLHIEPAVVRDLEWAGKVLDRSDLPGMTDVRARNPLGSALIRDVIDAFAFEVEPAGERDGERGAWLRGSRRQEVGAQGADVPLWDKVELFVRERDHAVLSARYIVGGKVVQEIVVEEVERDPKLAAAMFVVDGRDLPRKNVREHAPMWQQIERVVQRAEARAGKDVVRPSQR